LIHITCVANGRFSICKPAIFAVLVMQSPK
jgi:hypothetical protein